MQAFVLTISAVILSATVASSASASLCFITDVGECQGYEFGTKPGLPDSIQPIPDEDKCSELGFKKTSCSEGYSPSRYCPYDSRFFKECVCSETCESGWQENECSSGMVTVERNPKICKTCYKCRYCNDECPSGHTTESGSCRQATSYVSECGSACYKIQNNSCKSGQLSAPTESGGYKNKIVSYTDCGNPCFQSFNDNCPFGYVKTKASGKCYETTAKYTDYGTACYKEKSCCEGINWCELPKDCEGMGYKQQSCTTGSTVKCPYDLSYVFCL